MNESKAEVLLVFNKITKVWIVQGIKYDICVQGESKKETLKHFKTIFEDECRYASENKIELSNHIPPAAAVWGKVANEIKRESKYKKFINKLIYRKDPWQLERATA